MLRLRITAVCAVALGWSSSALADEISTIKLTDAGPDQNIPTNHSFYLTGDSGKNTLAVQAVIVRKGSSEIFGSDGVSCGELAGQLHIDRVAAKQLDAGVHDAFELFTDAASDTGSNKLLLSAQWVPPATGDASTYKVLMPTDDSFFGPGFSFCLFVLKQTQKVDDATIVAAIDEVVGVLDKCAASDTIAQAASDAATKDAVAACRTEAQTQFDAKIDKLLDDALLVAKPGSKAKPSCEGAKPKGDKPSDRDKAYCALEDAVTAALGFAETVYVKRSTLDKALAVTTGSTLVRGWLATSGAGADLGQAIVTMLTNQGSLFPSQKIEVTDTKKHANLAPKTTTTVAHVTKDGKIAVTFVSILDDDLHIRVASSNAPTGEQTRVLDGVTTNDLVVADGVTLHDLLLLRRGVVHLDKDTTFADLRTSIRKTALKPAWAASDRTYFEAVRDRIGKMFDVADVASPATFDEETPTAVRAHIKTWLAHDAVLPASVSALAANLKTLVAQKEAFDAASDKLTFVASTQVQLGGPQPIPFHIGFDQKTWLFSYVTPTVGYAQIDSHDGWFSTLYFSAQIHLFPNPVDDPMWQHGIARDLKRSFALELGLGSNLSSSFGPDGRYRGVFGLPPPFVAIALHPLPYTSISFGEALLERRTTVLSVESPHWAPSFFVGLNVQVNIPDLIRSQKTSAPTVDSSAAKK